MVAQFQSNENSSKNPVNLTVDREQASNQLELLGYGKDEAVYMRSFFPSCDPRSAKDPGRKSDQLNFDEIERWQREGRGVYFVVNGGGHKNDDVKMCRAIFYEHDNLDKESQLYLWETLGLPAATVQVDTGGKSIHSYWVFENPIPAEYWKVLQADLLDFSDGDRAIKNPARVMRLAGGWHISDKGIFPTTIVASSGRRYSYDELRKIIPEKETQPSPQAQAVHTIPLYQHYKNNTRWNDVDYARSYLAALKSYRVDDYSDWTTVGMALKAIDESLLADWDTWSQQSSKYKPGECLQKWQTFNGSGVGIGTLHHLADLDGWKNPFKEAPPKSHRIKTKVSNGGGGDDGGNVVNFPLAPFDINVVKSEIKDFLLTNYSEADLAAKKIELRATYSRLSEREIAHFFEVLAKEKEQIDSRQDLEKEIDNLIKLDERSLRISDYLPHEIAEPITQWCNWLNVRPEVALTTVLATASSLHTVGTKLIISQKRDFTVSPNMFCAVIAESGQKKSPIFRTLAKKPLRQLKIEAEQFYLEQYKDWEVEHEKWSEDKSNALGKGEPFHEPEPKSPNKPAPFYFNHATGEGITAAAAANPSKTLFALIDELAGYFKSQDAYRQGKGSDKQDVLSYHDGEGKTVLRAGGLKADVDEIYLSMYGSIQPAIIKKLMGNGDDPDGQWARFFLAHQPLAPSYMDSDDTGVNLHERITAVYRNCFAVPQELYTLSPEALKLYVPFYNKLEQLRVNHPSLGIRAIYSKAEGHTGVLALNLHVLSACALNVRPGKVISAQTMKRAIALMKFYIGQSKLLYSNAESQLAGHYLKIIQLSQRNEASGKDGWISHRHLHDAKIELNGRKVRSSDTREWMQELATMGKGRIRNNGGKLEFHHRVADSPPDGENGEATGKDVPRPETLVYKDYSPNGENGENGEDFGKNENSEFSPSLVNPEVEKVQILTEVEVESFSEKLPHIPRFPRLVPNDQSVSIPDGEEVSPLVSPSVPNTNNDDVGHANGVKDESPQTDHPHASDQPDAVSSGDSNDGDRQTENTPIPSTIYSSDPDQVAGSESDQAEPDSGNVAHQAASQTILDYPPIGWWVRVDGRLAQVTKHSFDNQTIFLDGMKKGNPGVYGCYYPNQYQALTESEMVRMKLSLEL